MNKLYGLLVILAVSFSQQSYADSQSKYLLPNVTGNWFKAVEYCHSVGRRLAEVENWEAEQNLYEAIRNSETFNNASKRVWIGANDLAEEGSFYWHDSGRPVKYASWDVYQPRNWGETGEHCTEIRAEFIVDEVELKWLWNDDNCNRLNYFVCEKADDH